MLLISRDATLFLRLDLQPWGRQHWEWLDYRIAVGKVEGGVIAVLDSSVGGPLFFERWTEPEVPALCDGLQAAIQGKAFSFTPLDEKNFLLTAKPSPQGVVLQIQVRHYPFPNESGWPLGVEVSTEGLELFITGLRLEYEQLMTCLPLSMHPPLPL